MSARRETIALTPCHWCGWDRPADLRVGSSYLENRQVIECIDDAACDARALTDAMSLGRFR